MPAGSMSRSFVGAGEKMNQSHPDPRLPWTAGTFPLMLAPMQGLTNRALRTLFIQRVRPDVVFTEYVRAQTGARKVISDSDRLEAASQSGGVPLVVQLIGTDPETLVAAADTVQELGCEHLNINLGCPYGRMTGNTAGGALLAEPRRLAVMLDGLRRAIRGGFSVKVRAGVDEPAQLFSLLPLFEECGVDFLIVHPRTVSQRYSGLADHRVTAEVVNRTRLPVIANGDVFTVADGRRVMEQTGAAGLMLGRGAIADPFLFERLRGRYPAVSSPEERLAELRRYLEELVERYQQMFCGEQQVLGKMKEVLAHIGDPALAKSVRRLQKCRKLDLFRELVAEFS